MSNLIFAALLLSYVQVQATTTGSPPSTPTGLVATMTSSTSILLTWSASSGSSTGYKIEYKADADQWFVLVANTGSVTSYSITGLTTGTTYTYRVSAINSAGSSDPSNAVSIATKSTTIPTSLAATAISPTSVFLSWTAPSQNFGQTITGYKIERVLAGGNYDTVVSSTASQNTVYTVTGLTTGKLYTFVVSAVYGATNSGQSNPASSTPIITSKAPANLPTGTVGSTNVPSIKMPSKNPLATKQTPIPDKSSISTTETPMEKAAREANSKAIADAKAALQKKIAAAKNGTSSGNSTANTEKQKAAQKLKEIQEENAKLAQRLKNQPGSR